MGLITKKQEILFGSARVDALEPNASLPAKFDRILEILGLEKHIKDKAVAVKMHLGGNLGYTTIHPFFIRRLVAKLKEKEARRVFICEEGGAVKKAVERGYTQEVVGAPIVEIDGPSRNYIVEKRVKYYGLRNIEIGGTINDAEFMIVLSHVKGHGDCAYGGACKNVAMGCVTSKTRGQIHELEGGLSWDAKKCDLCGKCVAACSHGAARIKKKKVEIFYHNCTWCRHCVLACPNRAIENTNTKYQRFQVGMAITARQILSTFKPKHVLYINFLTNITIFCDCWGFSTPSLVPDIGIMAGWDMAAIDAASLASIKTRDLIPGSLPKGRKLGKGRHLFHKIHHKDPYIQIRELERLGVGNPQFKIVEVK
ncbi:MAG: DUF362 domain-containing protein [bacterium]